MKTSLDLKLLQNVQRTPQQNLEIFIKIKEYQSSRFQIVQQQFSFQLLLGSRSCRSKIKSNLPLLKQTKYNR